MQLSGDGNSAGKLEITRGEDEHSSLTLETCLLNISSLFGRCCFDANSILLAFDCIMNKITLSLTIQVKFINYELHNIFHHYHKDSSNFLLFIYSMSLSLCASQARLHAAANVLESSCT